MVITLARKTAGFILSVEASEIYNCCNAQYCLNRTNAVKTSDVDLFDRFNYGQLCAVCFVYLMLYSTLA